MATLTNTQISVTYVGLLKTTGNTVLSSTAQQITDGTGNNTIMYLSTAGVGIGGAPASGKELDVTGNVKVTGDLIIDNLKIDGNTISAESGVVTLANGAIATTQSASDNSTKIATTAYVDAQAGLADTLSEVLALGNTTGATKIEVDNTSGGIDFIDNAKARFGTGDDLEIYHDGSNSYLYDAGTGELRINSDNAVRIRKHDNETMALFIVDGAVELYHDNSKKFETTSTGVSVTGDGTFSGDVIVNGGNLGVGMTPTEVLDIKTTSGDCRMRLDAPSGSDTEVKFFNAGAAQYTIGHDDDSDEFRIATTNVEDPMLSFTKAKNATFAGDVTSNNITAPAGFLGSSNGGLRIHSGGTKFFNITAANAARDGIMDIGASDARFKDLFLSGQVNAATISTTGNATFAGNVNITGTTITLSTAGGTGVIQSNQASGTNTAGGALQLYGGRSTGNAAGGDIQFFVTPAGSSGSSVNSPTQAMHIEASNSNIGIGTTSPGAKLQVAGESRLGGNLRVSTDGSFNTSASYTFRDGVYINNPNSTSATASVNSVMSLGASSGNPVFTSLITTGAIGVGTSLPGAALEVNSGGGIHLSDNTAGRTLIIKPSLTGSVHEFTSDNTSAGYSFSNNSSELMRIDSSGKLAIGTTTAVRHLQLQTITGARNYGIGLNDKDGVERGTIAIDVNTNNLITATTGSIQFFTGSTLGNIATLPTNERLRIDSSGNVMMGKTSQSSNAALTVKSMAGGNTGIILVEGDTTNDGHGLYASTDNKFVITRYTNGSFSDNFVMDSSGNVGIGTTSPSSQLHLSKAGGTLIKLGTSNNTSEIEAREVGGGQSLVLSSVNSADHLVIDGSGNVGIGTTSPGAVLEVFGTGNSLRLDSAANQSKSILFRNVGSGTAEIKTDGDLKLNAEDSGKTIQLFTQDTERMRIDSSGNLCFGKTTTAFNTVGINLFSNGEITAVRSSDKTLALNRRGSDGEIATFSKSDTQVGNISVTGAATAYNTSSDYRLKEDLQDFAGLDIVSKIPVYDFKWKTDESRSYGVMAHELEEVLPQAVNGEKDAEEMQSVDYSKIVPLLVKSIQELKKQIEILKNK